MLAIFAGCNSNTTGNTPVPSSVVTALLSAGACKVPDGTGILVYAQFRTTWAMANPDSTGAYITYLYRNGVLQTTLANTTLLYTETAVGVAGDTRHVVAVDYTYRVDVVRVADSQVMVSVTGNRYTDNFGNCVGPS